MKDIYFVGSSRDDIKGFGKPAARAIGYELHRLEIGREPTDWKPMSNIGSSVREIRTHEGNEYRTIYIAKYEEAIYVLHSFVKKSHKTAKKDIELAKIRLKEVNKLRK